MVVVPVHQMEAFEKRLKALNAKAERFGLEAIRAGAPVYRNYAIYREANRIGSGEHVTLIRDGTTPPREAEYDGLVRMAEIRLDYRIIKLGDWRVIAKIEAVPGSSDNVVFTVSQEAADAAAAESHRHQPIHCEHCGTHRGRKASYLLASKGSYKEVGQQCLEDFTGVDPAAALFLGKLHTFVSWEVDPRSLRPNAIPTREFLMRVAFLAERGGFVSATTAKCRPGLQPTYQVASLLDEELRDDDALRRDFAAQRERLGEHADAVRRWYALKQDVEGFEANVRTLLASDCLLLDAKHLAVAAAAVPGYRWQQDRQRRVAQQAADAKAGLHHVGTEGERCTLRVRVERIQTMETMFLSSAKLVLLRDEQNNPLIWWASGAVPEVFRDAAPDDWFECQFRVKEHGKYKGVPQTTITHVKVLAPQQVDEDTAERDDEPAEGLRPC